MLPFSPSSNWIFITAMASLLWLSACGDDTTGNKDSSSNDSVMAEETTDQTQDQATPDTLKPDGENPPDQKDAFSDKINPPDTDGVIPDTTPDETGPPEKFKIVVISEPRIQSNDALLSNGQLTTVINAINQETDIDFVLVLGDTAMRYLDPWFPTEDPGPWEDAFDLAASMLSTMTPPFYFVPGEREYVVEYIKAEQHTTTFADFDERQAILKNKFPTQYPGSGLSYTFKHKGVTFVGVNTMGGPMGYETAGQIGSLGADQMADLEETVKADDTVIVFGHHSPLFTAESDGSKTWMSILGDNKANMLGVFYGHRSEYQEHEIAGVKAFSFGGVFDAATNYAVVEIDPVARTITILNKGSLIFDDVQYTVEDACEPGSATVDDLTSLADTYHAVFFNKVSSDNDIVNSLFKTLTIDETNMMPFAVHVIGQTTDNQFELVVAEAQMYHQYVPEMTPAGDHAVTTIDMAENASCAKMEMLYQEPCVSINGPLEYNASNMMGITKTTMYDCSIPFAIPVTLFIDAQIGPDADGNLSIATAQAHTTITKATALKALKDFILAAYCKGACYTNYETGETGPAMEGENCDMAVNGDEAACGAGTFTFDDVPGQCDVLLGDLPARAAISFINLMDFDEITLFASGWGHKMVPTGEMDKDWALSSNIFFLLPSECTQQ